MKYVDFKEKIGEPVFSKQDVRMLGLKVFGYQLSLWQKKGYIIKLKNGLYAFTDQLSHITPEQIAGQLYSPSYISMEKALSFYGIIPEMVYSITSVTPKTTRRFRNKLGNFIFRQVKPSLYFGYHQADKHLMADPEKALLDYIYLNFKRVKKLDDLDEMRVNWRQIKALFSKRKLHKYARCCGNKKIEKLIREISGKI